MRYLLSMLLLLPLSAAWARDRHPGSDDRFRVEAVKIDFDRRRNETRVEGVIHNREGRIDRPVALEISFYDRGGSRLGEIAVEFDGFPGRDGRRFAGVARHADLRGWAMYSVAMRPRRPGPPPPPPPPDRDRPGHSDQRFRIDGLSFNAGHRPGSTRVAGVIRNVSRESFRDARFRVSFFDRHNQRLGAIEMHVDYLPSNSSAHFNESADGPNVRDWRHIVVQMLSFRSNDRPGPGPGPGPRPGPGPGPGPRPGPRPGMGMSPP